MEGASATELRLMSDIETMLQDMSWPTRVTRRNIGSDPNRKAFALGKVYQYDRPGQLVDSRFNKRFPELYAALKRLMRLHAPTFRYNSIQLNANVHTDPHYDKNNCGLSYAIGLGQFTGGGIVLYPEGGAAVRHPNKRKWVRFNGATTLHGSIPVTSGTRYSIIFFNRRTPCLKRRHISQDTRVRRRSRRGSRTR